nr:acyl-CoA dehydrogenase [Oryzicola mucosus]
MAEGVLIPAVAWQESYDLAGDHTSTKLSKENGGQNLSGRKILVTPGDEVDGFIVAASGAGVTTLVWVAANAEGVKVETRRAADGGEAATVHFENVAVTDDDVLSVDGAALLDEAQQLATIAVCAELLGLIRGAIDMTMDYLRTRKQFNRTIGSFQALQHRATDLFIQQELSAVAISRAVADFEMATDSRTRAIAASRAKARLSSAALIVTKEAIQMHGGIGYTDEHDIGLYLKRALTLSAWLGNAAEHRARFARLTLGEAA